MHKGKEDHMYQLMFSTGTEVPQEEDEVSTVIDKAVTRQYLQPQSGQALPEELGCGESWSSDVSLRTAVRLVWGLGCGSVGEVLA